MPNRSKKISAASDSETPTSPKPLRERRKFLALGAAGLATGVLEACATPAPGDDDAATGGVGGTTGGAGGTTGGSAGTTGGAGGTGGTTGGAGGTGGTTGGAGGTGGTTGGAGGTGGTTGGAGTGNATGGAGTGNATGGAGTGGADASGGAPQGGMSGSGVTGGMPNGGSGGAPPVGGGGKENNGASCPIMNVPTFQNAVANSKLPDPFKFIDGTRIADKGQWECLRAELSAMLQACIYGPKMPPPDKLTATFSGGKVTVDMTVGSNTANFSFSITGGGSAASPAPCLITCGGSSLGSLSGVAKIDMSNNSFASEMGLGGICKNLYGNTASKSGALIGWAWGCSRIIDALELVPEAGIDVKRLATTGCSRNGKGALAMGAFDERVALTIPQEGGSGGPACWRVSAAEKKAGQNIQESAEIVGEADWMGADFSQYANGQNDKLSADMHTAVALCAPRAVLVIDNNIDWLGPVACYAGGKGAMKLYEGLGIKDRCGVSVSTDHNHCSFPSSQQAYLTAFVNRFLKGMNDDTSGVDELNTKSTTSKLGKFDEATWIDWTIPTLTGALAWDPFA